MLTLSFSFLNLSLFSLFGLNFFFMLGNLFFYDQMLKFSSFEFKFLLLDLFVRKSLFQVFNGLFQFRSLMFQFSSLFNFNLHFFLVLFILSLSILTILLLFVKEYFITLFLLLLEVFFNLFNSLASSLFFFSELFFMSLRIFLDFSLSPNLTIRIRQACLSDRFSKMFLLFFEESSLFFSFLLKNLLFFNLSESNSFLMFLDLFS